MRYFFYDWKDSVTTGNNRVFMILISIISVLLLLACPAGVVISIMAGANIVRSIIITVVVYAVVIAFWIYLYKH